MRKIKLDKGDGRILMRPTKLALYGVCLVLMGIFPLLAGDYDVVLLSRVMCFAILALSLDLIWGYAGLLSFGQGAFFGIGSYGIGLVLKYVQFPGDTYLGIIAGTFGAAALGAVLGYFLFYGRVSGIYFGIITLALTTILYAIVNHPDAFYVTGGQNGLYGAFLNPKYGIPGLWEYKRTVISNFGNYYTAMAALVFAFAVSVFLVNSPFGRILRAVQDNEERLEFFGYNVAKIKIAIFSISCGMAGFAGSISVPVLFTGPTFFGLLFSTSAIIWVALGGRGTLVGPVIGALIVTYVESWLSTQFEYLWVLLMGLFFVIFVLFQPEGLFGLFKKLQRMVPERFREKERRRA